MNEASRWRTDGSVRLCLDMTDVLTRGVYQGLRWVGLQRAA